MRTYLADAQSWIPLSKGTTTDAAWCSVKNNITDAMDFFIPSKNIKHRYSDKPWFNDQCRAAVGNKQKAYKKWQNCRTREAWTLYMNSKSTCQRIRRARIQFSYHLEQELKSADQKQWWKLVKSVTDSSKTSAIPPYYATNSLSSKPQLC